MPHLKVKRFNLSYNLATFGDSQILSKNDLFPGFFDIDMTSADLEISFAHVKILTKNDHFSIL